MTLFTFFSFTSFTFFTFYGYITNSQCGQLPDGLIGQLVEHCTVLQTSWVRISFRPEFFSGFNFTTAQVACITAMINHKLISFSAVQIYDLSYIHLHSKGLQLKTNLHFSPCTNIHCIFSAVKLHPKKGK